MSWNTIWVLLSHELRMLVRDRRTVILSFVLPIAVMPLMVFGTRYVNQRRTKSLDETTYRYAITGSDAESARALIVRARENIANSPVADGEDGRPSLEKFKCEEVKIENPEASLKSKEIHFFLEALSGDEADARARKAE